MFSWTSLPRMSSSKPPVIINLHDSTPTEQDSILLHGSLLDELPLIELVDFSASCLVSVLQGQGDVLVRDGHTSPSFKMS